ncbi:hypothetical protein D6827_00300, partial [Candidatus Parcubacteria bacterium]
LRFLPGTENIIYDKNVFDDDTIDLMIVFDCGDGEYLQKQSLPAVHKAPLIVFDHHKSNPGYGQINVINPQAGATAGLVWDFVKKAELPMDKNAAQCFLTGICTDTDFFTTSNTTAKCLQSAQELMAQGARFNDILENVARNRKVSVLKLWGLAFERLYFDDEFNALTTAITLQDMKRLNVSEGDFKSMINFLNIALADADMILVLKETDDGAVKGSLRSQKMDCIQFAERYGGGGHKRAAGFKIYNAYLEQRRGRWKIINKQ